MSASEQDLQAIYKTTLQRVQELEYLVDLSQNLTASLDVDKVLRHIAEGVVTILQAFGCAIFLLEDDGKTLTPRVVIDPDFEDEILATPIEIGNSLTGKAIKARHGLIFNEAFTIEDAYQVPGTTEDEEESVLSVPLIAGDEVLGAMTINRMSAKFSENDLWLAEAFGRYAAIALKNAQIHRALQLSNERFHHLFDNMSSGVVVYKAYDNGRDFIITNLNAAGERMGNIKREDITGKPVSQVFPQVMRFGLFEVLQRVWQTGKPENFLLTYTENDGLFRWRDNYVYKLPTGEIVAVYEDVTAQKQAELALKESEEKFRTLFDEAPVVVWTFDSDGRILDWNKTAERVYGWSADYVIGKTMFELMVQPKNVTRTQENIAAVFRGEVVLNEEFEDIRADGSYVILLTNEYPIKNAHGHVEKGICAEIDITARKQAEAALQESEARLRQAQKMESIGTLAGGIAHDFNNLLTAINGQAELGLMKLSEDHPARKNLDGILAAGNRAAKLTGQLLAFSRKQLHRPQTVGINRQIVALLDMLRHLIREDISIETQLAPDLPPINADPHQLEQILVNLVVNARDAIDAQPVGSRAKKITIQTDKIVLDEKYAISYPGARPGEYLCLCVTDTGVGMDETVRRKIFEPFFTTKPKGHGTGLGLATVYGIVKQNEGDIFVYSKKGLGTTFKILWPVSESAEMPDENSESQHKPVLTGTETILLVEDDEQVRTFTADSLRALGYTLRVAENGANALRLLAQKPTPVPDLLLTDVIMPEMDGSELAATLRLKLPELPVLFMSGYTNDLLDDQGTLHQSIRFLQKPFSIHELAQKVRTTLDTPA